ncbi:fascin-like [Ptychodera flava]|uniref:fascin-like n=1 Tax=Ptychodera flava TaxID=63121 RepID=UPI00396AAD30
MSNDTDKYMVFGLISSGKKYLTQENFGLKINALGKYLKTKQKWTVEQPAGEDASYIRSHLGRYLSADAKGNVNCEAETRGANEKFSLEVQKDGRWAIRSVTHGNYFGGSDDLLHCNNKTIGGTELWTVHVGVHPQVHIRSVINKRYAKLNDGELRVREDLPWGEEALITLGFQDGKYTIRTCDDKYLTRLGNLVEEVNEDAQFTLELISGKVAFKDCTGCYLSPIGPTASLKSKNKSPGKDELFVLEDSYPQGVFLAHNGKHVSLKQGQDLSANQPADTIEDNETFQLEYDDDSSKWALRASADKYWTLVPSSGIQATSIKKTAPEALFTVDYDGKDITIKANNGKYVTAKPSGHLFAISEAVTEKEKFKFRLINRPLLVLRGEHGIVGAKSKTKVECNCVNIKLLHLVYQDGAYKFKGADGKFWDVDNEGNVNMSEEGGEFILEFRQQSKLCIRAPNGKLLKGEQSGLFKANGEDVAPDTLFEF